MRINKKKFFVRIFILISVIGLLIYARFLATHETEREQLFSYYEGLINSLKGNSTTYLVCEKMFNIPIDKTVKNSIIGRNDGIVVVNSNGISEYNFSATPYWTMDFYIANPLLQVAGEWTIVAEEDGNKIKAFKLKEEIYNLEIDGQIKKIYLNDAGYLGVIYNKVGYKNAFAFINPNGEIVYSKYFANTTLIDVSIDSVGKKIAMIEADTNSAVINSAITYLDNRGNTLYSSIKKNTLLVEIDLFDDETIVIGDNLILSIDNQYNEKVVEEIDSEQVIGTAVDNKKIVKLYKDTNELFSDKTMIEIKNIEGKISGSGEVSGSAQALEVQNKTMALIMTDRIDFLTTKGNYIGSIFISSDYKDIELFKDGSYACIQTNDEIAIYKIR